MTLYENATKDLYSFLTAKGNISLLDYIFLEKLFKEYIYEYSLDAPYFLNARKFESTCDKGIQIFYCCSATYWFNENPIISCFYNETEFSARLSHYKSLNIIDLQKSTNEMFYRFSNQAAEVFQNYLNIIEA